LEALGTEMEVFLMSGKPTYEELAQRVRDLERETAERQRAEEDRKELKSKLKDTLKETESLKRLFPICAICKKFRDDEDYRQKIEKYFQSHSTTLISYNTCPDCMEKLSEALSIIF